ncbi:ligand-binding sensor domain-containing protein [Clostridium isatidis]|uniref:ligand-binding sensor domain-containing protein n=1 Tax=Clostridium isatidis TaxID=182773 RepID=UPI003AAB41F4
MKKIFLKLLYMIFIISIFIHSNSLYVNAETFEISKEKNLNFKRLTSEDGLSQTTVEYMFQDSRGYIWIGTDDGLKRYNGSEFKVYKYREDSPDSITGNYIIGIAEDNDNNIWVATTVGLNKIDPKTDEVKTYVSGEDGCNLSNNNITELLIDSLGDLYVATADGLNKYNKENDDFERLYYSEEEEILTSQVIYSVEEDIYGNYWIGTEEGLNKITRDTKEIIKYYSNKKENSISDNFIYDLYADNKGYLWVGTENNGLNKINIKSNEITQYLSNPEDSKALAGKEVRTILRDSRGIVWIATNNGLCRLDEERNEFLTFKSKIYDLQSIISDDVFSLMEDSSGTIWVGTTKGISMFNPENSFYNYRNDPFDENSISENFIYGIYEDKEGYLWVGTRREGLNVIDRKNGNIKRIKYEGIAYYRDIINIIPSNNIRDITGIDNEIWIATEKGLSKYDKNTKEFTNYFSDPDDSNSLISDDVKSLYLDDKGLLWIGTDLGVCTFDRKESFTNISEVFEDNNINASWVLDIIKDKDGVMWFACGFNNGLISFNTKTKEMNNYKNIENDASSLSFSTVNALAIDSKNNIWVGNSLRIK